MHSSPNNAALSSQVKKSAKQFLMLPVVHSHEFYEINYIFRRQLNSKLEQQCGLHEVATLGLLTAEIEVLNIQTIIINNK